MDHLRGADQSAANKFFKDAAKNGEKFRIIPLQQDMKRFEFFSPARNEGYGKLYVQEVHSTGVVFRDYKDTVGPNGLIDRKWVGEKIMNELERALLSVVDGDLNDFIPIKMASNFDLNCAAENLGPLILSKEALVRVLSEWQGMRRTANDVQQWASFVRRGYVAGGSGGVRPLDIIFDENNEDLIVEIIARLDDIGDLVDGEVDASELQQMLVDLNR